MSISTYLNRKSPHHAYLIEGNFKTVLPEILEFLEDLKINTKESSDFYKQEFDFFKIEDARNLKAMNFEKNLNSPKRIFILSINSILHEAQTSLLKLFEEPTTQSIFFLVVRDVNSLSKTLLSRFYFIPDIENNLRDIKEAEKFIKMSKFDRIEFIKKMLTDTEEEDAENKNFTNSPRHRATEFLDTLEQALVLRTVLDIKIFENIFKTRKYLRQNGTSPKNLLESVALIIPNL
jgi:DNA polymerase III delta prime subunit